MNRPDRNSEAPLKECALRYGELSLERFKIISKFFAALTLILLVATGCSNSRKEVIEDSTINNKPQSTSIQDKDEDLPEDEDNFDINKIYGHWVIGDVVFRDIWTVAKDGQKENSIRFEDYVGSIIEYNKNTVVVNGDVYEAKLISAKLENFNDLMRSMNTLESVHLDFMENYNLSRDSTCYNVFFEPIAMDTTIPNMSSRIIFLNENHILFLGLGVFFNGYRIGINNLDRNELPTPPELADPQYLYGKWVIQCALDGSLYANESNTDQYIGYTLEYHKDFIVLEDIVYNNPQYAYDVPLPEMEFEKWFPYVKDDILLGVSYFYMQYIFIDGMRLDDLFGVCLYYVNEDTILVQHGNALYQAKRV